MKQKSFNPKKKAMWFFLGGTSLFLGVILFFLYFAIIAPMKGYISQEPFPIEHFSKSLEKEQNIREKVGSFFNEESDKILSLNSEEVNHLIRTNKRIDDFNVQYQIELQDSLFNIKCSVPVNKLKNSLTSLAKVLNLQNGYINAEVEGYMRLRDGSLKIISTRAQMDGKQAPFGLLGKRTHLDVGKFFIDKDHYQRILRQIESVVIRNELLLITKK